MTPLCYGCINPESLRSAWRRPIKLCPKCRKIMKGHSSQQQETQPCAQR